MNGQTNGPRWPGEQPAEAAQDAPSLFDLTERLERSLRSRHTGHTWFAEVEAKMHAYRACLQHHIAAADGEFGWISDLRHDAPRIEPLARRARVDFARLDDMAMGVMASLQRTSRHGREVRHDLRQLIELTRRHRARCARLVHEALAVDIGVG
jgi:hypothetical protein